MHRKFTSSVLFVMAAATFSCHTNVREPGAVSATMGATREVLPPTTPLGFREECFILREVEGPTVVRQGGASCARRVSPASTFKIPHALIALATGVRTGPDDLERWDGTKRALATWNRDQTLASALQTSAVWYFQRTAARIGRERMTEQLDHLHYGNGVVGNDITRFWLDGSLQITADEQAEFMERFVRRRLPFNPDVVDTVDAMMLQQPGAIMRGDPYPVDMTWDEPTKIYAKTGAYDGDVGHVRWLVGHAVSSSDSAVPTPRKWVFVSLVASKEALSTEAITFAMAELGKNGIVRPKSAENTAH